MTAMLLLLPVWFFTTKLAIVVSLFGTNHSIDAFHLPHNAITGTQHYHQQQQQQQHQRRRRRVHQDDEKLVRRFVSKENTNEDTTNTNNDDDDDGTSTNNPEKKKKSVVIIGAGWGGLSVAHTLSSQSEISLDITVIDAAPSVGGLVRDGYQTVNGIVTAGAEAGQHGFWDNYANIFNLLDNDIPSIKNDIDTKILTGYAEQGQYSPQGLEAVWPVYRHQVPQLPTGLAQGLYTKFMTLPVLDRLSAVPLILAFSEFDDSIEAWKKYDQLSFYDLCCIKLGVSKRCYYEAFEPMILTGLFAPGNECSAAAALGMAYFFVLKNQNAFDVRWCKGNIGTAIFQPWIDQMKSPASSSTASHRDHRTQQPVTFKMSTRVIGFEQEQEEQQQDEHKNSIHNSNDKDDDNENNNNGITKVICTTSNDDKHNATTMSIDCDAVVFAVGGAALNTFVKYSPNVLGRYEEFRKFTNLRGTGVLATRLYFDSYLDVPYSANACWGFDDGIGMTFFDITTLHNMDKNGDATGIDDATTATTIKGSIIEVDYYHAGPLLVMDDTSIVAKVKNDLNTILGRDCIAATVVDAAIVRLPQAVNWYSPGSYANMPDVQSSSIPNVYFAGDIVRTRHGSWSQEKAFVTGREAANSILGRDTMDGIIPLDPDEAHVAIGRKGFATIQNMIQKGPLPLPSSIVDFLW